MPRHLIVTLAMLPLLGGCTYLISGMQKNMERDGQAVEVCMKHELTLQAQQVAYKRTVSGLLAKRIGFPPDGTFDDTSRSVSALLARAEDRLKSTYAEFLEELDRLRNNEATRERIEELETQIKVIETEIKELGDLASELRKLARGISDTVKSEFDALDSGIVHYTRYGPSILVAASKIRSDVVLLQVELTKFKRAIDSILSKVEAIVQQDDYSDIESFKELERLIVKYRSEFSQPISEALENAKLILLGLRNGISFEDFLTSQDRELLRDTLDVVIRFKVAQIAVGRLEKGIYIVEAKLNQVDEKIWVLVSLAQITLTSGIRDAISTSVDEAFEDGTTTKSRSTRQKSFQALTRAYIDEKTYDGEAGTTDPKKKGKLEDYWLWPLATAACERLLVNKNDKELNAARTDQLLAPLYWTVVERFDKRAQEQSDNPNRLIAAKIKEYFMRVGAPAMAKQIVNIDAFDEISESNLISETLVNYFEPSTTDYGANPIGSEPKTWENFKQDVIVKMNSLTVALNEPDKGMAANAPAKADVVKILSNNLFKEHQAALVLKLFHMPSSTMIGDFDQLNRRMRANPLALERDYLVCRLAWKNGNDGKLVKRKLDLEDAGVELTNSDTGLRQNSTRCKHVLGR